MRSFDDARSFKRPLFLFLSVLLGLWVVEGVLLKWGIRLPWSETPLLSPLAPVRDRFSDLTNFLMRVRQFGHPGMLARRDLGLPFPYPLPSVFAFMPFLRYSLRCYIVFTSASFMGVTVVFARRMWLRSRSIEIQLAIWLTLILFFPMWFLIDRGNIEVVLWLLITIAIYCFQRRKYGFAAVLFGIAASMKVYPAVLAFLFFKKGGVRFAVLTLGVALTVTVGTYWIAGPTILQAMNDTKAGASLLKTVQIAALASIVIRWDHSVFALLKQLYFTYRNIPETEFNVASWITPYGILGSASFLVAYIFRVRNLPVANQVFTLLLFSVLLPYVSYEYTLVHLSTIFGCAIVLSWEKRDCQLNEKEQAITMLAAFMLAVTFSPVTNLLVTGYSGQIKCICLFVLLLLALIYPLPSKLFGDIESNA